jgi:hypothetical protein
MGAGVVTSVGAEVESAIGPFLAERILVVRGLGGAGRKLNKVNYI